MGTDIHGIWQKKDKEAGKWVDIPSEYGQNRHYQLFAVLAGVRNGHGFAGVKTGEPVVPISEPRGLPEDFIMEEYCEQYEGADEVDVCFSYGHPIPSRDIIDPLRISFAEDSVTHYYLGDHSFSWLSGEEMMSWYGNAPVVRKTGIIDREQFENWDGVSSPSYWCGGVGGNNIRVAPEYTGEDWTHIRISWDESLRDSLDYFFKEVERLQEEHGEIRFVFGFDS